MKWPWSKDKKSTSKPKLQIEIVPPTPAETRLVVVSESMSDQADELVDLVEELKKYLAPGSSSE